ncbi:hypothetical protein [Methanobrevibacter sp.]|uniref:hypothetical protein n=1 Tax=Methanobrevibacter sp. TaxID=66852 RepID=UPI003D7DBF82
MNWISIAFSAITSLFKSDDGKGANWVTIILCLFSFVLILTIGYLQGQIRDLNIEVTQHKQNIALLKVTIAEQNDAIEASRADYKLISEEFGRLGNVLDERYSELVIKEGEKFRKAECNDKLEMIKSSFESFKHQLNIEIRREYEAEVNNNIK